MPIRAARTLACWPLPWLHALSRSDAFVDPDGYSQHGQYEGWSSADNCRHFLRCTPRFGRLLPASRPELQKEDGSQTSTVVKGQVLELTGSAADAVTPNEPQSCETEASTPLNALGSGSGSGSGHMLEYKSAAWTLTGGLRDDEWDPGEAPSDLLFPCAWYSLDVFRRIIEDPSRELPNLRLLRSVHLGRVWKGSVAAFGKPTEPLPDDARA
ncbi:hypothetical protein B0J12DRAFT_704746 [Macrophomina phaseolina]|uniref:Uncharacterized protein n=1 Tax=Macrophomina phaseolina TaxID=35725 RepID=A0ABQ8FUD7_9PEZI|nr:hypothetical protein B0J12DRAFT_704746 [Macrophomina phaseolina]